MTHVLGFVSGRVTAVSVLVAPAAAQAAPVHEGASAAGAAAHGSRSSAPSLPPEALHNSCASAAPGAQTGDERPAGGWPPSSAHVPTDP